MAMTVDIDMDIGYWICDTDTGLNVDVENRSCSQISRCKCKLPRSVERVAPICLACQRLSTSSGALLGQIGLVAWILSYLASRLLMVLVDHWQLHAAHVLSELKDDKST